MYNLTSVLCFKNKRFERKSSSIEISERPYETDFNIGLKIIFIIVFHTTFLIHLIFIFVDESVFDLKNSKIKEVCIF